MLTLKDLLPAAHDHFPVDDFLHRAVESAPGLGIVAGLDPPPVSELNSNVELLPSGRATFFNALFEHMLTSLEEPKAVLVAGGDMPRRRRRKSRIEQVRIDERTSPRQALLSAIARSPDLIGLDRLDADTLPIALDAARRGTRIIAQLDTPFWGRGVYEQILPLASEGLSGLSWIISVQRLSANCPHCSQPYEPEQDEFARLQTLGQDTGEEHTPAQFLHARGCKRCGYSGRKGDLALADLFLIEAGRPPQNSQFPIARQAVSLARAGLLDPHTALDLESQQSQALYRRYRVAENLLLHARSENTRRLAELESARRVLENRTRSLFTLQDIGRALIRTHDRATLAQRIGRYALELCGAERFVLYLQEADGGLLILASQGWGQDLEGVRISPGEAALREPTTQPIPFDELPPGVPALSEEEVDKEPKAGLRAALLAEGEQVGWMVLHSDRQGSFQPGEIALLQTFANQAALALQRAGLIDDLRLKIQKLEAAQESLAQKERLVHELELARQVQQAMLPGHFPQAPGLRFTARNRPARQVGGDFYDVFRIDEDQIGIAVADVSDKGMPAALYMALTRSLLRAEARRGDNPGHVLAELNSLLLEIGRPDLFVTVFYAVLDLPARTLTYARAGHERPALLRDGGVRLLGGEGIPLALFDGAEFSLIGESLRMLPGDRLVLYSDGLYDLLSPQEEHFGRARLIEWMRSHAGEEQETFSEKLFAELEAHQGEAEQFDDMTLVVMDVVS